MDQRNYFEQCFKDVQEHNDSQCEELTAGLREGQAQTEVCHGRLHIIETKHSTDSDDLRKAMSALLHHGLDFHAESISSRMARAEQQGRAMATNTEDLDKKLQDSFNVCNESLQKLQARTRDLESTAKLEADKVVTLGKLCKDLAERSDEISAIVSRLEQADEDEGEEDTQRPPSSSKFGLSSKFGSDIEKVMTRAEDTQKAESANKFTGMARMLASRPVSKAGTKLLDDQMNQLLKWKEDMQNEFDGVLRVRRILEEKAEILDILDARTEQLTQQVQTLSGENWMEQLLQATGQQEERARSRGRSPSGRSQSPPQATGVGWTRALRPTKPDDRDLVLKGSSAVGSDDSRTPDPEAGRHRFARHHFHGTGWAKSPPRRPFSAGASRPQVSHSFQMSFQDRLELDQQQKELQEQQLQLEQQLEQQVDQEQEPKPERHCADQKNPTEPPRPSQEGPPTLESLLGGWKVPPVGAARTISRAVPLKVRQGKRRPMSAPSSR